MNSKIRKIPKFIIFNTISYVFHIYFPKKNILCMKPWLFIDPDRNYCINGHLIPEIFQLSRLHAAFFRLSYAALWMFLVLKTQTLFCEFTISVDIFCDSATWFLFVYLLKFCKNTYVYLSQGVWTQHTRKLSIRSIWNLTCSLEFM